MWRIIQRVVAVLTVLHALATAVFGRVLYPHDAWNQLLFSQHAFAFLFIALLNLVVWQAPARGSLSRWALHACNAGFLAFYVAMTVQKPEPPHVTAVVLLAAFLITGMMLELVLRAGPAVPARGFAPAPL